MYTKILKIIVVLSLITLPCTNLAEVITIDMVTVQIQPLEGKTFQLLFKFELPTLPKNVNIDYASLNIGVNVSAPLSGEMLEILSTASASQGKVAAYIILTLRCHK